MNKYTLGVIGIVIIVFIAFAFNASSKDADKNKQITSVITAEKMTHDFGEIDIFAGKVSTDYVLRNEGEQDVKIMSAITSCMCTEGQIGGMKFSMHSATGGYVTIPAGGEEILTATYDPMAHGPNGTGKITRELTVKTNSTATPEITVKLSANVVKN